MNLGLKLGIGRRRRAASIGPNFTVQPTISGTAEIGETLTRTTGTAVGTGVVTYVTEWQRDGVAIAAETGATYVLAAADDETTVRVKITATDDTGDRVAYSSGASVTYAAPVAADGIAAQLWEIGVAISALNVAADFTGSNLTYALAPASDALPAGLSLSGAGSITGTPTDETLNRSIVVRGTNSGDFDDSTFLVTSSAKPVLSGASLNEALNPPELGVTASETGDYFWLVDANATRTGAQVEAGGGQGSGTYPANEGATSTPIDLSGVALGSWFLHTVLKDAAGFYSNVESFEYVRAAPAIASTSPVDNATGASTTTSHTVTFSEAVQAGTGLFTLRVNNSGVWADHETFDVVTDAGAGEGQISFSGTTATINFTGTLDNSKEFAYRIAGTAVEDLSGIPFAGIADDTTWSFTTEAAAGGGITFPGTPTTGTVTNNAGATDITLPTSLENDLVFVVMAHDDATATFTANTAGWSAKMSNTGGAPSHIVFYKKMGVTPDTVLNVTLTSPNSRVCGTGAFIARGVDTVTPFDVADPSVVINGGYTSPAITTVTNNAAVIVIDFSDDDDVAGTATPPTGYTNIVQADTGQASTTVGSSSLVAYKIIATAGTETPGAWTATPALNDAQRDYTMALRPAA